MFRSSLALQQLLRATAVLLLKPKNATRRPVRTKHSELWWRRAVPSHLTARSLEESPYAPSFSHFQEEVDRPHYLKNEGNVPCFQCKKNIDSALEDRTNFIWVPSGNAKDPYYFHLRCFHCAKCGFRFFNSQFYSLENKAVCIQCALGRQPKYPPRWWHGHSSCHSPGVSSLPWTPLA